MEKYHLIEVILSCIWRMFVPSVEQDRSDDDDYDDEHILKMHPFARRWTESSVVCYGMSLLVLDDSSSGMVVNVEHPLIVRNVYWPLLSDFVNILSQEKIALTIMENKKFFHLWLRFLTLFQGMNVNERILNQHVEYEPQAYVYAFTIELEICAAAMWCFVNHLQANVRECSRSLMSSDWFGLSGSIRRKKWSAAFNRSSPVSMNGCNPYISKRIRSIRGC